MQEWAARSATGHAFGVPVVGIGLVIAVLIIVGVIVSRRKD